MKTALKYFENWENGWGFNSVSPKKILYFFFCQFSLFLIKEGGKRGQFWWNSQGCSRMSLKLSSYQLPTTTCDVFQSSFHWVCSSLIFHLFHLKFRGKTPGGNCSVKPLWLSNEDRQEGFRLWTDLYIKKVTAKTSLSAWIVWELKMAPQEIWMNSQSSQGKKNLRNSKEDFSTNVESSSPLLFP